MAKRKPVGRDEIVEVLVESAGWSREFAFHAADRFLGRFEVFEKPDRDSDGSGS